MFGSEKRRRRKRHQEIAAQWSAIQRYVFEQLRPSFRAAYGQFPGGQLAQGVVDRIFAR